MVPRLHLNWTKKNLALQRILNTIYRQSGSGLVTFLTTLCIMPKLLSRRNMMIAQNVGLRALPTTLLHSPASTSRYRLMINIISPSRDSTTNTNEIGKEKGVIICNNNFRHT